MRDSFPLLEILRIPVKRSMSDRHETRFYEVLGTLPCLRKVSLDLNCSLSQTELYSEDIVEPSDGFYREWCLAGGGWRKGQTRNILINAAVDEALVRSIWDIIATNKARCSLKYLKVISRIEYDPNYPSGIDLWDRVRQLTCSYVLTSESDDGKITRLRELGKMGQKQEYISQQRRVICCLEEGTTCFLS